MNSVFVVAGGNNDDRHGGMFGQLKTGTAEKESNALALAPRTHDQEVGVDRWRAATQEHGAWVSVGDDPMNVVHVDIALLGEG